MGWLGMHPEQLLEADALEAGEPLLLPGAAGQPLRPLHLSTELWPVRGAATGPSRSQRPPRSAWAAAMVI